MSLYDTTIGTLLVGVFFNTFLYGLVTYQFAAYYRTKFNDRRVTRYMVFFLFVLDTFHTAATIYMAWTYTVTNYDNPAALAVAEWPYTFTPIATALTALVTQIYLGFRIWCMTTNKTLYAIVILLAIPSFILGMACGIEAWLIKVLSELPRITPLVIAWLSMQVIVDTFITVTLTVIFSRSRTGFQKTDTILNRLIRGAIQTGLFAGVFSMGDLITFVVLPSTNLYGMFAIPIGRIYTNTLLDTLLTRKSLKAEMGGTYDVDRASSPMDWTPADSFQAASTVRSTHIQLKVRKTIQEDDHLSTGEVEGKIVPLAV